MDPATRDAAFRERGVSYSARSALIGEIDAARAAEMNAAIASVRTAAAVITREVQNCRRASRMAFTAVSM